MMYRIGDRVVFKHNKATHSGIVKAIMPVLDRYGCTINYKAFIETRYTDMTGVEHTTTARVLLRNIVGLAEEEKQVTS